MRLPLVKEICYQQPLRIFNKFAELDGAVFLDSANQEICGDFSYIAVAPSRIMIRKNEKENPLDELRKLLDEFPLQRHENLPSFQGGVAGYLAYDLGQHLEKIYPAQADEMQFPDLMLGFYDVVIAFDHRQKRAWIFSSGYPEQDEVARQARAATRLSWLLAELENIPELPPLIENAEHVITANFSAADYQAAVRKVIEYILAGDIFEANISQRFQARLDLPPFQLYRRLRYLNPAPFAAFLKFSDVVLASASPERFLKLKGRQVEARPIKGTRKRGLTPEADQRLAEELLQSEKDHAENVMIVDLLRNDLSRVCEDHSVKVTQLCELETYAAVHHLVSVVRGKLRENLTAIDLLCAAFPGGSITGAPKVRAMEIIAEIEPAQRGPYCGGIGYIGFDGGMDFSITIRTFAIKNKIVNFQAGGAIVADSDSLEEYQETLTKAQALMKALSSRLRVREGMS